MGPVYPGRQAVRSARAIKFSCLPTLFLAKKGRQAGRPNRNQDAPEKALGMKAKRKDMCRPETDVIRKMYVFCVV